eukprot:s179_g38.t1
MFHQRWDEPFHHLLPSDVYLLPAVTADLKVDETTAAAFVRLLAADTPDNFRVWAAKLNLFDEDAVYGHGMGLARTPSLSGKVSEREEAALQMFQQPDQKSRKRSEALAGQQRELVLRRAKKHFGDKAFAPAFEAGIDLLRLNLSRHDAKEQGVMHIAHAYVNNDFTPFPLKQLCKRLLQSWVAA